jgi:hypothetical protein
MFCAALTELAALKPNAKLSPEAYAAWWNAMHERWTLLEFQAACARLRDTHEFMPNPFHFEQLRKASRMTAGEAWGLVRDAVRSDGECPDDPRVQSAVRALGGMRAIGFTHTDQMQFLERRFAEHYEAINDAEDVREAVPMITGPKRRSGPLSLTQLLSERS